jgi:catechol 2,3-dioxygenase-like lactoylglutathione lyase family enzyme
VISGAHVVIYSAEAEADRAFVRDVLTFENVDAGEGWLIFRLPPAELAFHPGAAGSSHELYLICDDLEAFVARMTSQGVACSEVSTERWGRITRITLPGGGSLGVYQPTHPSPLT